MIKKLAVVIIVLSQIVCHSQTVNETVMNYQNKSRIISNSRRLILDKFIENDVQQVKEVKNYLINEVENSNYITLYPLEHWLILYWTQEYSELASAIADIDSVKLASYNTRIKPEYDQLASTLKSRSHANSDSLILLIDKSSLDDETKQFLKINLKYLLINVGYNDFLQDSINDDVILYVRNYPQGRFNNYSRNYIYQNQIPKNWGAGFEIFTGYGHFTGSISEAFTDNIALGIAFDIGYKKFDLYLRDYIGMSRTKVDVPYHDVVWEKGTNSNVMVPEASIGYSIYNSNKHKISPFGGIGGVHISASSNEESKNKDLKDVEVTTFSYMLGVNYDFKFGEKNVPKCNPKSAYPYFRIRYCYSLCDFNNENYRSKSNMHYITLGLGVFARNNKPAKLNITN